MQGAQEGDLWVVRTINEDGTYGEEGLVPSAYLEKDSEEEVAARRLSIGIQLPKDNKEIEALKLRECVDFPCFINYISFLIHLFCVYSLFPSWSFLPIPTANRTA